MRQFYTDNNILLCFINKVNYCAQQVLNYLAALEPSELGLVAELFFAPLSRALKQPADAGEASSPDSFAEWRCAVYYRGRLQVHKHSWGLHRVETCSCRSACSALSEPGCTS